MDQQPHGNFVAFMNHSKKPGDNLPTLDGRIALPGSEEERRFALWAHEYKNPKTGEMQIMLNGQTDAVSPGAAPLDQIVSMIRQESATNAEAVLGNLKLAPRQIVLFPNGFKAEAPTGQKQIRLGRAAIEVLDKNREYRAILTS
jgi:hypothetical protein